MVIPFPAAHAAPPPIGVLLDRCIGFLEGFEDDPAQCVGPLLQQLRFRQNADLIELPAPTPAPVTVSQCGTVTYSGSHLTGGGFTFSKRHLEDGRWFWTASRFDQDGHRWQTAGFAVVDDFGDLIEVPA